MMVKYCKEVSQKLEIEIDTLDYILLSTQIILHRASITMMNINLEYEILFVVFKITMIIILSFPLNILHLKAENYEIRDIVSLQSSFSTQI
jgi:hypothetical protein